MGAKKDINRVRELIFGKDIERFEQKFEQLEEAIVSMESEQRQFEKRIFKQLAQMDVHLEKIEGKQTTLDEAIQRTTAKTTQVFKEVLRQIEGESQHTSEQMKTLKTELKMYMKAKLNGMDKSKISQNELSRIFATLAEELEEVDSSLKHAR